MPRSAGSTGRRQRCSSWRSWSAGSTRLPRDKIEAELAYLSIALDKTAGEAELEAWGWLMARVTAHLTAGAARGGGLG